MTPTIVFDIDGTIADCSHRLHHILKDPKDWDSFYAEVLNDEPIVEMIELLQMYGETSYSIVLSTGRNRNCMADTRKWLMTHGTALSYDTIFFRENNDHRPDYELKLDHIKAMRLDGYDPVLVFEDRSSVVNMWREQGIKCLQVAKGDF